MTVQCHGVDPQATSGLHSPHNFQESVTSKSLWRICWQCCCRRFQCNLCGMVCECPPEYFCTTDGQGKRMDYHQRPELSQGSVEFIAPQEYMVSALSQLSVQSRLTCMGSEFCSMSGVHGLHPLRLDKSTAHLRMRFFLHHGTYSTADFEQDVDMGPDLSHKLPRRQSQHLTHATH